jgi:hypothetical protein
MAGTSNYNLVKWHRMCRGCGALGPVKRLTHLYSAPHLVESLVSSVFQHRYPYGGIANKLIPFSIPSFEAVFIEDDKKPRNSTTIKSKYKHNSVIMPFKHLKRVFSHLIDTVQISKDLLASADFAIFVNSR